MTIAEDYGNFGLVLPGKNEQNLNLLLFIIPVPPDPPFIRVPPRTPLSSSVVLSRRNNRKSSLRPSNLYLNVGNANWWSSVEDTGRSLAGTPAVSAPFEELPKKETCRECREVGVNLTEQMRVTRLLLTPVLELPHWLSEAAAEAATKVLANVNEDANEMQEEEDSEDQEEDEREEEEWGAFSDHVAAEKDAEEEDEEKDAEEEHEEKDAEEEEEEEEEEEAEEEVVLPKYRSTGSTRQ
ncbi:hypothetical protein FN846DRAFT_893414 [Sphaerosporella brunnea]|uniref:Uncharacterized protein n=1 Tax=Sphaerosporella brunnea TaxID=1250544 RepID=A0A5J5EKU0_9PEZI|nr:hypothetical protein FN846DRAFT_893414 [Sphaerosporella brunnea]